MRAPAPRGSPAKEAPTQVTRTDRYSQSVETLFRAFTTAEVIHARSEHVGARGVEVRECKPEGDGFRVVLRREMPSEIPSALKRFVQPWNEIVQTEGHCELTIRDRLVHASDVLIDDPAGPEVQVPDLGVAHLPVG